jgi:hypothetical protein
MFQGAEYYRSQTQAHVTPEAVTEEERAFQGPITGKSYKSYREMVAEESHEQMRLRGQGLAKTNENELTADQLREHIDLLAMNNTQAELRARFEVEGLAFFKIHPEIKFRAADGHITEQGKTNLRIMNSVMGAMGYDFVDKFPSVEEMERAADLAKQDGLLHLDHAAMTAEKAEQLDKVAAALRKEKQDLEDPAELYALPLEEIARRAGGHTI